MKSYTRLVTIIVIAIILTIIANIFTLLMLNNSIKELTSTYFHNQNLVENELEVKENNESNETEIITEEIDTNNLTEEMLQKSTEEEKNINVENSETQEKIIGTIKIPKINFEGEIYEGISLEVLAKGVGHFDNSPYLDGNVCLAAHNTSKFWAKLNTLKKGDKITYESFLGTREYEVFELSQIEETDWTSLENTDENMLTLITCVKGDKPKRLCVRAIEI